MHENTHFQSFLFPLWPNNTTTLCSSIAQVAQQHAPLLVPQAQEIASRFEKAFTLFRDCHNIYDSKKITDQLGEPLQTIDGLIFKKSFSYSQ